MPKTKYSEAAIDSLIAASRAMRAGKKEEANKHFSNADSAIGEHISYLKSIGNHQEADHAKKHYESQKRVMMSAHKFSVKSVGSKKAKKSDSDLNEIGKGVFLKAEKISTKMGLGQAGNPRYEYKGLHQLHPEDRQRVLGRSGNPAMYAGKEHHKFLYPTDSSGRLVHSSRIAAPGHHDFAAAKASMEGSEFKGNKYSEGQGVRVDQPGHELHGKLGMVQTPHPEFPDKISVLFSGGRKEFMDSSAVRPSSPSTVDKAKATVIDIRSRLKPKPEA